MLAVFLLSNCSSSPQSQPAKIKTALRCPSAPAELVAESKRAPHIKGETAFELAANLLTDVQRKNNALKRALAAYKACRAT